MLGVLSVCLRPSVPLSLCLYLCVSTISLPGCLSVSLSSPCVSAFVSPFLPLSFFPFLVSLSLGHCLSPFITILGAGEIFKQLRALTAPPEDLTLFPNNPMVAHNCLCLRFQRVLEPLLNSVGTKPTWYTDIHTHTQPKRSCTLYMFS